VGGETASETIENLARRGTLADARHLLDQLLPGGALRADVLDALTRILRRATPADLRSFESDGRAEYGWWFPWYRVDPRDLHNAPAAIRMLATFHPRGYVREEAVKSLASEDDALPYLLLRLNDWVEPVANSARRAMETCLARASAAAVIRCLPIVERLRTMRRRDLGAVVDSLERILARPSAIPALRETFASASPFIRRACVLYAGRHSSEDSLPLLLPLTADGDPVVASRATEALVRILPPTALRANLAPLLRSSIAKVRLLSLSALVVSGAADIDGPLRRATMDASAIVREFARHELARRESVDFVQAYAAALRAEGPTTLATALCGLRECGTRVDGPLAAPFVSHRSARVRVAAVRTVGKLDPEAYASVLARSLEDPSPRVIRAASEALRGRSHHLDKAHLRSLLEAGSPNAAVAALGLLCEEGYWAGLEVALGVARRPEAAVRAAAIAKLENLLGQQVYARPSNLGAIEAVLEASKEHLPIHLRPRIESSLAAARRMR
jgi:HEAT repeat protein